MNCVRVDKETQLFHLVRDGEVVAASADEEAIETATRLLFTNYDLRGWDGHCRICGSTELTDLDGSGCDISDLCADCESEP